MASFDFMLIPLPKLTFIKILFSSHLIGKFVGCTKFSQSWFKANVDDDSFRAFWWPNHS